MHWLQTSQGGGRREEIILRRVLPPLGLYLVVTVCYFAFAAPATVRFHTPYNHFALLADAWLGGSLSLAGAPPAYAGGNDFALFDGRWYVVFPPFPALLLVPFVWLAGSADNVADGQVFLWLAGLAPPLLLLLCEKCRKLGLCSLEGRHSVMIALLFAFGSVYFFTAVQGTVWFAAHVVGTLLLAVYLLCAIDASAPLLAGTCVGLAFLTRTPLIFSSVLFLLQSLSACRKTSPGQEAIHWQKLVRRLVPFTLPIGACLCFALWHNVARFGDPLDFGYQHLAIRWKGRIDTWGLFHYHYLAKNLGVILTSLPWLTPHGVTPFQINGHGLALWVTSPYYLSLLWVRTTAAPELVRHLWVTALVLALPTLFYQNTGWVQFGYRFSNDYALVLFVILYLSRVALSRLFLVAAALAIVVNGFGALSFNRAGFGAYYFIERTQNVLYQPDRR